MESYTWQKSLKSVILEHFTPKKSWKMTFSVDFNDISTSFITICTIPIRRWSKTVARTCFCVDFCVCPPKILFRSIFKYFWQNYYVFEAEFYALLTKLLRVVDQNFTLFWPIIWERVSSIFDHFLVLNKLKHAKFTKYPTTNGIFGYFCELWLYF